MPVNLFHPSLRAACVAMVALFLAGGVALAQPLVNVDAAITSIINVPELLCGEDSISPTVTLKNNGMVVLNAVTIQYTINGGAPYLLPWTGSLQSGQTVTVPLDTIPALPGTNELVVRASDPNNTFDEVPGNDAWTIAFTASFPAATINLILTLDDYGSDVTWELVSSAGILLYDGGPYADGSNGTVDSVAFCLTNDCYIFTIRDVFGNGLCCADGEGGYVIRDVYGTVYGESDGQYTVMEQEDFCLEAVAVPERLAPIVRIQPNPTNGSFDLVNEGAIGTTSAFVLDGLGRIVKRIPLAGTGRTAIQLDLPAGAYLLAVEGAFGRHVERFLLER